MGSMIGMLRSKKTQEKSSTGQSLFGCESSLSCPVMDIMFNPHKAENMWSKFFLCHCGVTYTAGRRSNL